MMEIDCNSLRFLFCFALFSVQVHDLEHSVCRGSAVHHYIICFGALVIQHLQSLLNELGSYYLFQLNFILSK